MIKVMFVCHGNICRSPMAEFMFKDMVRRAHREDEFEIASAATSREELGNPVYPPVRKLLNEHGIDCSQKTARQLLSTEYKSWDMFIWMDHANMRNMRIYGGDPAGKFSMLLDYTAFPGEVADPWYNDNFQKCWNDVYEGCAGLLDSLRDKLEI